METSLYLDHFRLQQPSVGEGIRQFLVCLQETRQRTDFWTKWYQGFLDGKPLDWELQRRVALIPDEDWEQGPAHIAQKIEEIQRAFERPKVDSQQLTEQAKRGGRGNSDRLLRWIA